MCANSQFVYAGTKNYGVYFTSNNGTNWTHSNLNNKTVNALASNIDNFIFAGTDSFGIYISSDNGLNWVQSTLNNISTTSMCISGYNIFAGSHNGFYASTDNGVNWVQRNEGLGNQYIHSLLVKEPYIFAGTKSNSIWRRNIGEIIGFKKTGENVPVSFTLYQNYPNPFNPVTKIKFSIPPVGQRHAFDVCLVVYDILGREVASLIPPLRGGEEGFQPGTYEADWDASNYPSGVYFYKLNADNYTETKKMVLMK